MQVKVFWILNETASVDYSLGIQKINTERIFDRKENHENAYQIAIIFKCTCSHEYAKDVNLKYRLQLEMNLIRNISFSEEPSGIQIFLFILIHYESRERFITNNFLICKSLSDLWIMRNKNTIFYENQEAIKVMMLKSIWKAIWEQLLRMRQCLYK